MMRRVLDGLRSAAVMALMLPVVAVLYLVFGPPDKIDED